MGRTRCIVGMKVNAHRCKSCPFNEDGVVDIREKVQARCLTEASQLCHGTGDKTLCRGARDFQLQAFVRLGVLKEATDECWDDTQRRMKEAKA